MKSFIVVHKLSSCGSEASKSTGLAAATLGLDCTMPHGILVPQPETEPASPALKGGLLNTGQPGMSLNFLNILSMTAILSFS